MDICELGRAVLENAVATAALRERVDYLNVAVMRGDPRFCKAEHATPEYDSAAFDRDWAAKGKRVPSTEEVFG